MHTLNPATDENAPPSSKQPSGKRKRVEDDPDADPDLDAPPTKAAKKTAGDSPADAAPKQKKLLQCTTAVGRMLSIVEIVQREFLASREVGEYGLHQYNQLSTLEEEGRAPATEQMDPLEAALRGKKQCVHFRRVICLLLTPNSTKINVTPFMRIYLSRQSLPELTEKGYTYQGEPVIKRKSRAAKAHDRSKRRAIARENQMAVDDT